MKIFNMIVDLSYNHLDSSYQQVFDQSIMFPMKATSMAWTLSTYDILCILSAEYNNLKDKSVGQFAFRQGYTSDSKGTLTTKYVPFLSSEYELNDYYGSKLSTQVRKKYKIIQISKEFDNTYKQFEDTYVEMVKSYYQDKDNSKHFVNYQHYFGNKFDLKKSLDKLYLVLHYNNKPYPSSYKFDEPYITFKDFLKFYEIVVFGKNDSYVLNNKNDLIEHYVYQHFKNQIKISTVEPQYLLGNLYDNIQLDEITGVWKFKYKLFFQTNDLSYLKEKYIDQVI
jgi:hypothetical protein